MALSLSAGVGVSIECGESSQEAPTVSVVVRCLNEEKHIGKLLYGIQRQQYNGSVEVIVVDSGSTDDTVAIAERLGARIVPIAPEEFSFGRALNWGCRAARGELLVFASAHVYPVYDDWLSRLLAPFERPRVALSYGRQRGGGETKFSEEQVFGQWFGDRSAADQETPFCNNANCAIRRHLWEAYPYDERLTGLEDLDWARRVKADGHQISYVAEAPVAHIHEETPKQIFNRYRREAIALKKIYPEQAMSPVDYVSLLMKNTAADCVQAAREGRLAANVGSVILFRAMQFSGAFWGFRQQGPVSDQLRRTFYYPRGLGHDHASRARDGAQRPIDYERGSR